MLPAPATHLAGAGRFPEGHWDGFWKAFWAGYRKVFGTGTLPTGTSVASSRGEEGFYRHFGTGTLPTGTSGAPSRGKGRLLAGLRHSDHTHRCLRVIPAWQRETSGRSSAQRPYPQVPQRHPRVAKRASISTLAQEPYPQVPQWHPRVAKGASGRSSARRPYPQVPQRHPRVANRASIGTLARRP